MEGNAMDEQTRLETMRIEDELANVAERVRLAAFSTSAMGVYETTPPETFEAMGTVLLELADRVSEASGALSRLRNGGK